MANNTSHHNALSTATHRMTTSGAKVWCATFATEAVVVTTGNLFIITVFVKSGELYRRPQHFFLINLAVADFLVGAFAEPLFVYILGGFYNLWSFKGSLFLGDISLLLDMFSGISSVAFLTAIAVERLYATLCPALYRNGTKKWLYALITVALWTVSAAISVARLMFGNNYDSLYVWMPFVCALLLLTGSAYFVIWIKLLYFSPKRLQQSRERKLNVTLSILTLTSLSTWLPFIILNTVNMFQPVGNLQAVYATKVLHYGNSLVNPFLFSFKMPKFREAAKKIFCTPQRNNVQNAGFSTKNTRVTTSQNDTRIPNMKVTAV